MEIKGMPSSGPGFHARGRIAHPHCRLNSAAADQLHDQNDQGNDQQDVDQIANAGAGKPETKRP